MTDKMVKLNTKRRNGSWNLTSAYLSYKREGGRMSPKAWNQRLKKLAKENRVCIHCGKSAFAGMICPDCFLKRRYKNNPKLKEIDEENIRKLDTIGRLAGK